MAEISSRQPIERSPPSTRRWPPSLAAAIPLGLLLLAVGAAVDIGHHTGLAVASSHQVADAGHLVTLAGMILTLAGSVWAGLRRRR